METALKNITTVTTGVYKKPDSNGDVLYLQANHFDGFGRLRKDAFLSKELMLNVKLQRHLLKHHDLLFVAKGEHNHACLYSEDIGRAVGSSTFLIIRVKDPKVLPEYLQWFFNLKTTQTKLQKMYRGTSIPSISKKDLMEFEVPVPDPAIQKQILNFCQLWNKEKAITSQLLEEKENFYQTLLMNLLDSNLY